MRTIYTTVGTSLLSHLGIELTNTGLNELRWNTPRTSILEDRFERLKSQIIEKAKDHTNNSNVSAEVQSTLKAKEKYGDIEVYLICTDSVMSPLCAMGIKLILEAQKIPVKFKTNNAFIIEGLEVIGEAAATQFEDVGILNLFRLIHQLENAKTQQHTNDLTAALEAIPMKDLTKEELRNERIKINDSFEKLSRASRSVFNISGGYKGIIPIMTIIAQLYGSDTIYNYEAGEKLITIGEMPINFDWTLANLYGKFIFEKEHLIQGLSKEEKEIITELSNLGLYRLNKTGTCFKQTIIGKIYGEFVSSEHPVAENVMGLFMEMLVYKYYQRFKNNDIKKIEHSIKLTHLLPADKLNFARELDIYEEYVDGSFSISEVKSYLQIFLMQFDQQKKFLNQIESQLNQFTIIGQFPVEYRLIIYKAQNVKNKTLVDSVKLIDEKINYITKGKTKFVPLYFTIDYRLSNRGYYSNPYQRILTTGITHDFLKPLNFK